MDSVFNKKYFGAWFCSKSGKDLLGQISSRYLVKDLEVDGWYTFNVSLDYALVPSDFIEDKRIYNYLFLLRVRNKKNFLLLSTRSDYAEAFISKCLEAKSWEYANPPTNVHGIVNYLYTDRAHTNYRLGGMWGRTDGVSPNIKTMSFFGDDILQTKIFIEYLMDIILPTRIIIKELNFRDKTALSKQVLNEVCTVSESSEVSFNFYNSESLDAINRLFRLISEEVLGFLNLSVMESPNE